MLSYFLPNGDVRTVSLKDKHSVTIGRNEESDIYIATTICSRDHAVVSLDENGNVCMPYHLHLAIDIATPLTQPRLSSATFQASYLYQN